MLILDNFDTIGNVFFDQPVTILRNPTLSKQWDNMQCQLGSGHVIQNRVIVIYHLLVLPQSMFDEAIGLPGYNVRVHVVHR